MKTAIKKGDQVVLSIDGEEISAKYQGEVPFGILCRDPASEDFLEYNLDQEQELTAEGIPSMVDLLREAMAEFKFETLRGVSDDVCVKILCRWDELKRGQKYWFYDRRDSFLLDDGSTVWTLEVDSWRVSNEI